jgi:formylglycine-generating enzyme required for sulfatase activity/CheY-like chemotaxis protein
MGALRGLDGHEVRPAISPEKALANAETLGGVDLLVTDVVMEPMNGFQLRTELAARYPGVRAVFLSEYDLSDYAADIAGSPVLAKPVDPETLIATVRAELAAPAMAAAPAAPVEVQPEAIEAAAAAAATEPIPEPAAEEAYSIAATPEPEPPAPVAVPRAVPQAVPVAAAVPVAKVVPAATPVAVPKAVPAAPKAVPAAPKAVPVATPKAVPVAQPILPPKAVPAAPKVVPAAVPVAKAVPSAPTAVPGAPRVVAAPTSPAAPKGVPAAPRVVATPKAPVPVAPKLGSPSVPMPATSAPFEGDVAPGQVSSIPEPAPLTGFDSNAVAMSLIGQMIGGYQIVSPLGEGRWGPVFAAVQVAINRPVGLKVLDPQRAADPELKQRFIADARAKANVQHPSILSVYEAGAADEWIFYTHEYVDGQSLAEMAAARQQIDQATALKILRVAAEGMLYFEKNTIPHGTMEPNDVFLGVDGLPRLANLATQLADQPASTAVEMETLGRALMAVLPPGAAITPPLRALLGRTQRAHNAPIPSWDALLQGVKALEPKIVPLEAAKISAQDRAAVEAVEKARAQQKRAFMLNVGAMLSLVALLAFAVWYVFIRSNQRRLDAQIHIAGGDFISGTGVNSNVAEFWIDKYECSIGQYAKFVEWIEQNPGNEHDYDHVKQPKHLSHVPVNWKIYYLNAVANKAVHSVPQSLNSPAMVSWWDAYAYAKWKGRDLPTELEWERAARGTKGFAYTWGEEPDAKRANTGSDYVPRDPTVKGKIDGFNYWGDVDAQKLDKSPDGVIGMQGNVSEWVNAWTADDKTPILKGGNFSRPLQPLHDRITDQPAERSDEFTGFRTISRTPPNKE